MDIWNLTQKEAVRLFRKPRRLKGKALKALHEAVYKRDNGICQKCGRWIELGTPAHHKIFKSKSGPDTMDNLQMLCGECHYKIHHG